MVLSLLNTAYKVLVVYSAVLLSMAFSKRDAVLQQMELDAGLGAGAPAAKASSTSATTSSGEPLNPGSLAAQSGR